MFAMNDSYHLLHNIGMLGSYVMIFVNVRCQVVEMRFSFLHNQFPVAHTHTNLVCLMKFPIQEVMLLLLVVLPQHCRSERDTVEAIALQLLVQILFGEFLVAYQLAERRHHVVKSQLVVVYRTGRYMSRPAYNKGNTDTAFVALTFQSAQLTVASEKFRIGTTFLVRAVVAAEDDQCILVKSLLLQFGQNLAHIGVQTSNHTRKFGMCMHHGIITRTFATAPRLVHEKLLLISL